ncbi:MAG: sporulation stage IV protein A [Lachnospiraceae bacterium]
MMMTNIETEVTLALGGEKASEEIMGFLLQGFDGDVSRIWESNIFGKSLYDIAEEGLEAKIKRMPPSVQNKLRNTMQRIVNEGSGGLICIILSKTGPVGFPPGRSRFSDVRLRLARQRVFDEQECAADEDQGIRRYGQIELQKAPAGVRAAA